MAVGNCCYVADCSAAQGASSPTGEERGGGISWRPPAYSLSRSACIGILMRDNKTSSRRGICFIVPRPYMVRALSDDAHLTSVCQRLSVAYIGPKSRTESPTKTKIGTEVAYVTRDSDTIFKVKRSKVNLQGRGILWRPLAQLVYMLFCLFASLRPFCVVNLTILT